MSSSYISKQKLTTSLSLHSSELNNDIDSIIKHKIKENLEGRCFQDGYIIKDSIRIIKRNLGDIVTNNQRSEIKYKIVYTAEIISPSKGDEIEMKVNNINKMGVLGYIKLKEGDTSEDSPLIIMVPREYITDSSVNFNDLIIGQTLHVIVIGFRIKYNSRNIQIIAKPI
tara:strand:+ start:59 stop:565 length:507 start_codon:yes stop_codon:yes gene_type:complete